MYPSGGADVGRKGFLADDTEIEIDTSANMRGRGARVSYGSRKEILGEVKNNNSPTNQTVHCLSKREKKTRCHSETDASPPSSKSPRLLENRASKETTTLRTPELALQAAVLSTMTALTADLAHQHRARSTTSSRTIDSRSPSKRTSPQASLRMPRRSRWNGARPRSVSRSRQKMTTRAARRRMGL